MKTKWRSLEFSVPPTIENMRNPFTIHTISVHSFCPFLQLSTVHPQLISKWGNRLNHLTTWLFSYTAYSENQVSNILRHSQLNQCNLDCLWSWTSLHSFFVAGISKLSSIIYLHRKKRPLVIDLVIMLLPLPDDRLPYVLMGIPRGFFVSIISFGKRGNSLWLFKTYNCQTFSLFCHSPEHHSRETNFTGTVETNIWRNSI